MGLQLTRKELMKRTLLLIFSLFIFGVFATAQAPTRLYDVRNGNGIVDNGTAQPQATYIAYKDAAAKQAVIDAFCDVGNYDGLDPATRPTRQAFFNRELLAHVKDVVKQSRQRTIQRATPVVNESDLP